MTVAELIKKLQKYPDSMKVYHVGYEEGYCPLNVCDSVANDFDSAETGGELKEGERYLIMTY